jgi:hypothetical protein
LRKQSENKIKNNKDYSFLEAIKPSLNKMISKRAKVAVLLPVSYLSNIENILSQGTVK